VPIASGGTGTYLSRTNGLVQQSNPGNVPDPQWPFVAGFNFAVNPVNGNELLIGSGQGRLFRTRDQGLNWIQKGFVAGDPGATASNTLDGTQIPALAFGARDPSNPLPDTDLFFYAGTLGGSIYVTFDGGARSSASPRRLRAERLHPGHQPQPAPGQFRGLRGHDQRRLLDRRLEERHDVDEAQRHGGHGRPPGVAQ
jgi:hypothetical protein